MLEPDLSTASLHVISASEVTPHNFIYTFFEDYRICEDTLVSCWIRDDPARPEQYQCGVYTGLTSARFSNFISHGGPAAKMLLPDIEYEYVHYLCPASGRYVRMDSSSSVVVFDFFWYNKLLLTFVVIMVAQILICGILPIISSMIVVSSFLKWKQKNVGVQGTYQIL